MRARVPDDKGRPFHCGSAAKLAGCAHQLSEDLREYHEAAPPHQTKCRFFRVKTLGLWD
jgi:hypothetical protein